MIIQGWISFCLSKNSISSTHWNYMYIINIIDKLFIDHLPYQVQHKISDLSHKELNEKSNNFWLRGISNQEEKLYTLWQLAKNSDEWTLYDNCLEGWTLVTKQSDYYTSVSHCMKTWNISCHVIGNTGYITCQEVFCIKMRLPTSWAVSSWDSLMRQFHKVNSAWNLISKILTYKINSPLCYLYTNRKSIMWLKPTLDLPKPAVARHLCLVWSVLVSMLGSPWFCR